MNLQKLNQAIEMLKFEIPKGLLCTGIISLEDGQSLVGYKNDAVTDALLTQITIYTQQAVSTTVIKRLNRFYMMHLASQKVCLCVIVRNYWWEIVVDPTQVSLGMLFNVVIPKAVQTLEEALD